jgi:hypothetical protein
MGDLLGCLETLEWIETFLQHQVLDGLRDQQGTAGLQQGGNWYAEGSLAGDGSSFVEQLVFCSAGWQVPQFEGFLVACIRPGPDLAPVGLQVRTDAQLAADAARSGVALQRADYDALLQAGRALLVPQAVEHLVLQEGFDPLKSF